MKISEKGLSFIMLIHPICIVGLIFGIFYLGEYLTKSGFMSPYGIGWMFGVLCITLVNIVDHKFHKWLEEKIKNLKDEEDET